MSLKCKCEVLPDGFSFGNGAGGWKKIGFSLNGKRLEKGTVEGKRLIEVAGGIEQVIGFQTLGNNALVATRTVRNIGDKLLTLDSIEDGILTPEARIHIEKIHEYNISYYHTDNARTEAYPHSRPETPLFRQIPYNEMVLGLGEANAFPAVALFDSEQDVVLVEADLNQTEFLRSWRLGMLGIGEKQWNNPVRCLRGIQHAPLSEPRTLAPGEDAVVSTVFYQVLKGVSPENAFGDYIDELNRRYDFAGAKSAMLHGGVFCTWNYGTLYHIDEELLARRSAALAEKVPGCTHFLIDDGYQQDRNMRNGPLDCFYPVPAERYDRERFPSGMKAMANKIKETGLIPCIWLSPTVYLDSPLAKEHPEWLLCDRNGSPELIGDKCTYLDLSIDGACEFFLAVLDALLVDWGYRGIKFDFMTQWFSLEKARFKKRNGLYWRDWVFSEIRKRIGDDGLLMTCIAMSMGNPFNALHADAYRCGCDIHDGTWAEQIKAVKMTLPQLLLEGRKTYLLNMDSAGFGNVPLNEQLFRLTWIFITQGLLEIGGPVESMPQEQLDLWQKMLTTADRGHKVACLDKRALTGDGFPQVLMVEYPEDSVTYQRGVRKHIALFNWAEHDAFVGAAWSKIGHGENLSQRDVWTDESIEFSSNGIWEFLKPHSARLIEILK